MTHQGFRCTKHGGLIIYINEKYSYKLRNLYDKSDVWEGLFIDVNGHKLSKTLTIGNMYRPAHDNNNNKNIEKFIDEISPIIDIIQKEWCAQTAFSQELFQHALQNDHRVWLIRYFVKYI